MKKIISLLLCLIMMLSFVTTMASAEENYGVAPCLNNTLTTTTVFTIENGVAEVHIRYDGYEGLCTGATITTKIQKKFLIFFWKEVDIGTPDNVWVDEIEGDFYQGYHSTPISSTGTYRAVVEYVIRGTGGADDVIEIEREYEYK